MFKKAVRSQIKLRAAICGPTGSGKTYTALKLAGVLGKRIALIDTERESSKLYADVNDFDACDLVDHRPEAFSDAIREAHGYDVLIIDSLSHAWEGVLEELDRVSKGNKSFNAWRDVTPRHKALVHSILGFDGHVIVTMRSKMEYLVENGGKKVTKIGLAPVQRAGLEYEFDLVMEMDQEHSLVVTKSRFSELSDLMVPHPGVEFGAKVLKCVSDGAPPITDQQAGEIISLLADLGIHDDDRMESRIGIALGERHRVTITSLRKSQAVDVIAHLHEKMAAKAIYDREQARLEADRVEENEEAEMAEEGGDDV